MLSKLHLTFTTICINIFFYVAIAADVNDASCLSENITDSIHASVIISLLNNAKNLLEDAKTYAAFIKSTSTNELHCGEPMDCADVLERDPHAKSGVYRIWPRSQVTKGLIEVFCDMEDDGGAWTVIQRRGDFNSGQDYFYRDWIAYRVGFGDLEKDHWLGNDNIFALTNQRSNIVKFALSDWEGNQTYATYDEFWIEDESRLYTMHVTGYRGTAGDSLSSTNGLPFTTKDQDNDKHSKNCAVIIKGAWWYSGCHTSNLNGMYLKGTQESGTGVDWHGFRGCNYSLKDSVIKIRPKYFKKNSGDRISL